MLATDQITPYRAYTPKTVTLSDGSELAVPDKMTLAEFEKFPWPEGRRWELIWGVPVMTPSPQPGHQDLLLQMAYTLEDGAKQRQGTKLYVGVDVRLPDSESYVCPDLMIVPFEGDIRDYSVPLTDLPYVVVESLSPSTSSNDQGAKRDAYARAGVPEYWIADPSTGSLAILVDPKDGEYRESPADEEGFLYSPFLEKALRIRRTASGYDIQYKQT